MELEKIERSSVDPATGDVWLACTDRNGGEHELVFKAGAVGELLAAMAAQPLTENRQPDPAFRKYLRPLRPKGCRAITLYSTGEPCLEFQMADRLSLPVVLPSAFVEAAKQAWAKLAR